MGKYFYLLIACISITNATVAQPIEDYLSAPFPTELTRSANGKTIAWTFNQKGVRNVFVADAPLFVAKQITPYKNDDGMEMTGISLVPDGGKVLYVRGNGTNTKGEAANPANLQTSTERTIYVANTNDTGILKIGLGFAPKISPNSKSVAYIYAGQIWLASLDSGKPKKLFQSRGSNHAIRWSPDGSKLVFISSRGDHALIGLYDVKTQNISFPDPSTDIDDAPAWSADGKWLTYCRTTNVDGELPHTPQRTAQPWRIRLLNVETNEAKEIWKADTGKGSALFTDLPVVDNLLAWAGNDIIFPWEKDGWVHLYSLNSENGHVKLLTKGDGEVERYTVSNDKKSIYYSTNIGDLSRRHIWKCDIADAIASPLTKGITIEWLPVETTAGITLLHSSYNKPAWPALLQQDGSLKDIAPALFPINFPTSFVLPQNIMITAADGMQIPAIIYLPKNIKAGEKHPALVFFHGGSRRQMMPAYHYSSYYSNAYSQNQYFVNKGYIVLVVNYRSGIGYGLNFREALNYGPQGASEYNDVVGAGKYLQSRNEVDAKRIGLWGGSYGGFLTAMGLAKASDMFAAGVDLHGVHDWNAEYKNRPDIYETPIKNNFAELALASSPMHYLSTWRSPVLLIQGDDDLNVVFSQTVMLAEKLRQQNVHVEQLVFPDEIHDFLLYRNWIKAYKAANDFFEREMK